MQSRDTHPGVETPDEGELVARLKHGDPHACEVLVQLYGGRILSVARRILRDDEDARDVVQETFVSAFRGIERFSQASTLWTWLHRIAVNAALTKLRGAGRRYEQPIEPLLPAFQSDGHHVSSFVHWRTADRAIEREETRRLVRACIDRLPEPYRTVLLLRDIEELDIAETAQVLGVNPATVKTRLHRARQALRTLLDHSLRGTP